MNLETGLSMPARVLPDFTQPSSLSESASRAPTTPGLSGFSSTGSTLRCSRLSWWRCMMSRAISTVSNVRSMLVEKALDETGSEDEVSTTSKPRVGAGDKVVKMGSENTGGFHQHSLPTPMHHGDTQHRSRQVDHLDVNDEESHAGATFVLGEGPNQGHDQG